MSSIQIRDATLLVIEFGASWPRWLDPSRAGDMAVVAQHYEGEPSSLLDQVARRVTRLDARNWRLHSAIFVSNGRCDDASVAARSVLVWGLLGRLKVTGGMRLVLSLDERLGRRACVNLMTLGNSIGRDASAAGVSLSVHVGGFAEVNARRPGREQLAS